MSDSISRYREEVHRAAETVPADQVMAAAQALRDVQRRRGTVFVLCPPDDAGSVSHFVSELEQGIGAGLFQFRLVRLYGAADQVIAWQNDWAYEDVYAEQLRAQVRAGDAVIAVSRRGQSLGMARALRAARRSGATALVVVGCDGGELMDLADVCLHVRSDRPEQIADVQTMLAHMLGAGLRQLLGRGMPAEEPGGSKPR